MNFNYIIHPFLKSSLILGCILFLTLHTSCYSDNQSKSISSVQKPSLNQQIIDDPNLRSIVDKFNYFKLLYDSLEYYNEREIQSKICRIKIEIAEEMRKSGNYSEGIKLFNEALKQSHTINCIEQNGKIFNGLSEIYYELFFHNKILISYLDSSLFYANKALKISIDEKSSSLQASTLNIIGGINIHKGNYNIAEQYLKTADSINTNIETDLAIKNNLAYTYYMLGDYKSALPLAKESFIASANAKEIVFSGISLDNMIKIYNAMGDTSSAKLAYNKLQELKSQKNVFVQSLMIKQLSLSYDQQQDKKTILDLLNNHFLLIKYSRILAVLSFLLLLVSLTSIFILRQKKKIRQKEKELSESIKISNELKIKNAELLIQKKKAEEKILKTDLEIKETALASKLLSQSQIHEFLSSLKHKIKTKKSSIKEKKTINFFNELELTITHQQNNYNLEEFELLYASGNSSFINKIKTTHPNLSTNEKKLCYLIMMDLTTKDISNILHKSYRSVEMARHRLRTKLNIERTDSLHKYLLKFSETHLT